MRFPTPLPVGAASRPQWGWFILLCQALTERACVLALHFCFLYPCSNPCLVCGFEMIMSCSFSSLVCRFSFLTKWVTCLWIYHLRKTNVTCCNIQHRLACLLAPTKRSVDRRWAAWIYFLPHSIRHITSCRECQFIAAQGEFLYPQGNDTKVSQGAAPRRPAWLYFSINELSRESHALAWQSCLDPWWDWMVSLHALFHGRAGLIALFRISTTQKKSKVLDFQAFLSKD